MKKKQNDAWLTKNFLCIKLNDVKTYYPKTKENIEYAKSLVEKVRKGRNSQKNV